MNDVRAATDKIYHWLAIPYMLVAGPYYGAHIVIASVPVALAIAATAVGRPSILFGVSILGIGGAVSLVAMGLLRYRQYSAAVARSVNPNAEVINEHCYYSVRSGNEYVYEREFLIRSNINGLDSYRARFGWTGRGEVRITEQRGGKVTIEKNTNQADSILLYKFEPPLKKGETRAIASKVLLQDIDQIARPFFALAISHPITGDMRLVAKFDSTRRPNKCQKILYPSSVATVPLDVNDVNLSDFSDAVVWQERRPKLNHRYCIAWTF